MDSASEESMVLEKRYGSAFLSVMILAGIGGCASGDNGGGISAKPMAAAIQPAATASTLPRGSAGETSSIANPIAESSTSGGSSTADNLGAACAPWAVFPLSGNALTVTPEWVAVDTFTVTYLGNGNTGG
ncbi:MAG: hypothetical protein ABR991_08295, partial [Terracidiphilus sp.]